MALTREDEHDVACAVEAFSFVDGAYVLHLPARARANADALRFAVVLSPYGVNQLVQAHYALVEATDGRELPGRVLYIDGSSRSPGPLAHARRILLDDEERDAARVRIARRRATATARAAFEMRRADIERAFFELARSSLASSVSARFGDELVLAVEPDPFPSERRARVLLIDDDPTTEAAAAALDDIDTVLVHDGWSAIDRCTTESFDLVVCAVSVGGFSGAQLLRVVAKSNPSMASTFVFLAGARAVADAPPSSALARVLTRPLDPAAVVALLRRR